MAGPNEAGRPDSGSGLGGRDDRPRFTPWLSTIGSMIALFVSGVSLWETVLKQPSLKVYVGESMFYTRDPFGSYEVFVVPITIVNSGAQDGAVTSLKLDLANIESKPSVSTAGAAAFKRPC